MLWPLIFLRKKDESDKSIVGFEAELTALKVRSGYVFSLALPLPHFVIFNNRKSTMTPLEILLSDPKYSRTTACARTRTSKPP